MQRDREVENERENYIDREIRENERTNREKEMDSPDGRRCLQG